MTKYLILYLLISLQNVFGQQEKPLNNPIYDNQLYHFGFTLGISHNKLNIDYNREFILSNQTEFNSILSKYEPGFNVGIIIDFRLTQNTNIRLNPSFNFTDQKLYYSTDNNQIIHPKNNTGISNFELPIYIKYRSDRINNGRSYLLLGSKFMLDMNSLEQLTQNQTIKFSKINYSVDIGVGFDLYFAYFKFSPEIKYSHGLKNIFIDQDNINNDMINMLHSKSILISLTFE